jgi:uncharacterized membrane protein YjjP (DUF1212 family)
MSSLKEHGFMAGLVLCFLAAVAGALGWYLANKVFTGLALVMIIAGIALLLCGKDPEEQETEKRQSQQL